jgi:hypothetical protein
MGFGGLVWQHFYQQLYQQAGFFWGQTAVSEPRMEDSASF